jgi:hypothetical protein
MTLPPSESLDAGPTASVIAPPAGESTAPRIEAPPAAASVVASQCVRVFVSVDASGAHLVVAPSGGLPPAGSVELLLVATSPALDLVSFLQPRR